MRGKKDATTFTLKCRNVEMGNVVASFFPLIIYNIYIYTQPNYLVLIQVKNNTMYWWWLQRVFIPGVFSGRWYNGQKENQTIYIGNKRSLLIGMARIRQLRVRSSKFYLLLLLFAFQ